MNTQILNGNKQMSEKPILYAARLLEEVIGPSASRVNAEWKFNKDEGGRPHVVLRISDGTGEVTTKFSPHELHDHSSLRYSLIRLWGDLLQIRSHKQLERLTAEAIV